MTNIVLLASSTLILVGIVVVAATRNIIKIMLGIQTMSLGSVLMLAYAFSQSKQISRDVVVIIGIATAISEVAIMTALLLYWFRFKTVDTRTIESVGG
mgnify:CR=1 FL=1